MSTAEIFKVLIINNQKFIRSSIITNMVSLLIFSGLSFTYYVKGNYIIALSYLIAIFILSIIQLVVVIKSISYLRAEHNKALSKQNKLVLVSTIVAIMLSIGIHYKTYSLNTRTIAYVQNNSQKSIFVESYTYNNEIKPGDVKQFRIEKLPGEIVLYNGKKAFINRADTSIDWDDFTRKIELSYENFSLKKK